jgi:predicted small integral membrane protein
MINTFIVVAFVIRISLNMKLVLISVKTKKKKIFIILLGYAFLHGAFLQGVPIGIWLDISLKRKKSKNLF